MIRYLERLLSFLPARELAIWMVILWVLYYVTGAIWSTEAFANFVNLIEASTAVRAGFMVFLALFALSILKSVLGRRRHGIFYLLLWIILPLGVFTFLFGFFLSSGYRQAGRVLTSEGNLIQPPWVERGYTVTEIKPAIEQKALDLAFEGRVFQYEPVAILTQREQDYEVGVFPPANLDGTYYHILNFGIAPGVSFKLGDGRVLDEGYMALQMLPPGNPDEFKLPDSPYRVEIRLLPNESVERGSEKRRVYDFENPLYGLTVYRGDQQVFDGTSAEAVSFDNMELGFFEPVYWVLIQAAEDHGVPFILAGLALVLVGLLLRIPAAILRSLRPE